jgi:tetratricopeptide (TPR) repeat protein
MNEMILPQKGKKIIFLVLFSWFYIGVSGGFAQKNLEEQLEKARAMGDSGKIAPAMKIINEVILKNPKLAKAYHYKGRIYLDMNKLDSARWMFEKTLSLDKLYANSYYNIGYSYVLQEEPEKALPYFRQFSALKPNDGDGYLRQGNIKEALNEPDSAIYFYEKSYAQEPTFWQGPYTLSDYYRRAKQLEKAEEYINKALTINDKEAPIYVQRAVILENLEKFEESSTSYTRALEIDPKNQDALLGQASTAMMLGYPEKAINDAKSILQNDSTNYRALHLLAVAYLNREEWNNALQTLKKAQKFYPEEEVFIRLEAYVHLYQKEYKKAFALFDQACKLNPEIIENFRQKNYARWMMNTNPSVWQAGKEVFKDLVSSQTAQMTQWINDPKNGYSFAKLQDKFTKNYAEMGLDEIFMFYFGTTSQKNYSPYALPMIIKPISEQMEGFLGKKEYSACIKTGQDFLKQYPAAIEIYLPLAIAYYESGDFVNYSEAISKYHAFINAILATGDGKSTQSAWVVISVRDEYVVLGYLGLTTSSQALLNDNGHSFDRMNCANENKDEFSFYFNIDKPFSSMAGSLKDKKDNKKKSKVKKGKKVE